MNYQKINDMMTHGGDLLGTKLSFDHVTEAGIAELQFIEELGQRREEIVALTQSIMGVLDGHTKSEILWSLLNSLCIAVDQDIPEDYMKKVVRLVVCRQLFKGGDL